MNRLPLLTEHMVLDNCHEIHHLVVDVGTANWTDEDRECCRIYLDQIASVVGCSAQRIVDQWQRQGVHDAVGMFAAVERLRLRILKSEGAEVVAALAGDGFTRRSPRV